jgi:signal peptidase I
VSDHDEPIDPLDPRFVDAILARARRRAAPGDRTAEDVLPEDKPFAPPATPFAPPATPFAPPATPVDAPSVESAPYAAASPTAFTSTPTFDADTVDLGEPTDLDDDDDEDRNRRTRNAVEWIAVAVGAVVVAFLIRAFLLQAFYIPSESMEPTLYENDRILVNKLSYKLHDINRGDLVVFEKPPNEPANDINDLIKRVIALEDETIELHSDGTITIDGRLLNEPYLRDGLLSTNTTTMSRSEFVEGACTNPVSETTKCTLGDGFVWVMGDNRDHSHDSRAFGPIDEDLVVGRAFVKVWPLSEIGFL